MNLTPFSPRAAASCALVLSISLAHLSDSAELEVRGVPRADLNTVDSIGNTTWIATASGSYSTGGVNLGPGVAVYRSLDAGESWTSQKLSESVSISTLIRFANESLGFLITRDHIYRTEDGGDTWEAQTWEEAYPITDIVFQSSERMFLTANSSVYFSEDGGQSWSLYLSNVGENYMHFVNADVGYHSYGNIVYKTENGGQSWEVVFNSFPEVTNGGLLHFTNVNSGFVIEGSNVIRTTDGGADWKFYENAVPGQHLGVPSQRADIQFHDDQNGMLFLDAVYRTTDGGSNWTEVMFDDDFEPAALTRHPETSQYLVTGKNGRVRRIASDGTTLDDFSLGLRLLGTGSWQGASYTQSVFVTESVGWATDSGTTSSGSELENAVYETKDGGVVWRKVELPNIGSRRVLDLQLLDDDTVMALGTQGGLWKKGSNSEEWTYENTGITSEIQASDFISPENGWIIDANGEIYRTQNDAASWILHAKPNGKPATHVDFYDDNHGWIASEDTIFYTIDGGASWDTILNFPTGETAWSMQARGADSLLLLSTPPQGGPLRATEWKPGEDSVPEWRTLSERLPYRVEDVQFINPCLGFAFGVSLHFTEDGGESWERLLNLAVSNGSRLTNNFRPRGTFLNGNEYQYIDLLGTTRAALFNTDEPTLVAFSDYEIDSPYPLVISFGSEAGSEYIIESSDDLVEWTLECDRIIATGPQAEWTDPSLTDHDSYPRFYRVYKVEADGPE